MEGCIFCRIIAGELPARVVYEDEHVIAFDDVAPQAPVHTLVVPRRHVVNLSDPAAEEMMAEVFAAVPKVARVKDVSETGYRVIVNNGADAKQSVAHLHVHIIGGREMSHGMVPFPED